MAFPEDKLVNIDRSWDYWNDNQFFKEIRDSGKEKQLVFKSPVQLNYIELFIENGNRLNYIPIIKSKEEADLVLSHEKLNCIGLELIIDNANSELLDPIWLSKIKNQGLMTLINAEHLGEGFNLLGGLTDHDAI